MVDMTRYTEIEKNHIFDDLSSFKILLIGIETKIGKALYDFYTADGLIVSAPLRDELNLNNLEELEDFHSVSSSDGIHFSLVINCESSFSPGKYTPEEFIGRHQNLITFASKNGATYICMSTLEVFDGSIKADVSTERSPITQQGEIFSIIEEFLVSTYSDFDNNFFCLRLPWVFSQTLDPADIYEYDLAEEVEKFAEGKTEIFVANNIYSRPYSIEILLQDLPYFLLSNSKGIFHIGSLESSSLYDFALTILADEEVTVTSFEETLLSGSTDPATFSIISPFNNQVAKISLDIVNPAQAFLINIIRLKTMLDCYKEGNLDSFIALPKDMYATWWYLDPAYLGTDFLDVPQEYIDFISKTLEDITLGNTALDEDTSQEEFDRDLFMFSYLFT